MQHGFRKLGRRYDRLAQRDLNLAAAGRRFPPRSVARRPGKDEQATLGAGMLDGDPQQRLDELTEDDLAGHRLRGLDHRPDIKLLGGRANGSGGRCRDWCVAEMRMKLFELAAPCRTRPSAGNSVALPADRHGRSYRSLAP